ncbi:MAG: hypothetical protein IKU19_03850, partial [Clostridia bacterium]|nr:hypothetical protein [Clostridia bacterium]
MDNNNNKRSPLDEIKRVTNEVTAKPKASFQSPRVNVQPKPAPVERITPPSQYTQKPAQTPAQTSQRPSVQRAASNDFDIDAPSFMQRSPADNLSRAEKVRMAREKAIQAREQNQQTRVTDLSNITPEQASELEKQREEAHRLVQQNQAAKKKHYATRETPVVKPRPEQKKKIEKNGNNFSDEFEETVGRGVLSNTVKAVVYIVSVLVVSGCLALFAIFVGNDCFAFVKSDA